MEEISSEVSQVAMDIILPLLDISPSLDVSRPHGRVDLLIGADNCDIVPIPVKTVGKLQLMRGTFW